MQIEKDFELLNSDAAGGLYERWPQLAPQVLGAVKQTVKDKNVLQVLSSVSPDASNG